MSTKPNSGHSIAAVLRTVTVPMMILATLTAKVVGAFGDTKVFCTLCSNGHSIAPASSGGSGSIGGIQCGELDTRGRSAEFTSRECLILQTLANTALDNPCGCQETPEPTVPPSLVPSTVPFFLPSVVTSFPPSMVPSDSFSPSFSPSTSSPSETPSLNPTDIPSSIPSSQPSGTPSLNPTNVPTSIPSLNPTDIPTSIPSSQPSSDPTETESSEPSGVPSFSLVPTTTPCVPSPPAGCPTFDVTCEVLPKQAGSTDWYLSDINTSCDTVCTGQSKTCGTAQEATLNDVDTADEYKYILDLFDVGMFCDAEISFTNSANAPFAGSAAGDGRYKGTPSPPSLCSAASSTRNRFCCCGTNCPIS